MVLLGDHRCGKSVLIKRYLSNEFMEEYKPTNIETYDTILEFEKTVLKITICEASGNDDLLHLAFPGSNLFILCYSVGDAESFKNISKVKEKIKFTIQWKSMIEKHSKKTPFILVALKTDLYRQEENSNLISQKEGETFSEELNSFGFFELSSKDGEGVVEFFQKCVENVLKLKKPDQKKRKSLVQKIFGK
jgi:Rho family, other